MLMSSTGRGPREAGGLAQRRGGATLYVSCRVRRRRSAGEERSGMAGRDEAATTPIFSPPGVLLLSLPPGPRGHQEARALNLIDERIRSPIVLFSVCFLLSSVSFPRLRPETSCFSSATLALRACFSDDRRHSRAKQSSTEPPELSSCGGGLEEEEEPSRGGGLTRTTWAFWGARRSSGAQRGK